MFGEGKARAGAFEIFAVKSQRATSPGMTTTATPRFPMAALIADSMTAGS